MHTQIIAHRGASHDAPENTMAAFRLAHAQGAQMLEFDVRATADGTIVIFHDDTTERWNGRADPSGSLTFEQFLALDIGGAQVPTLDELLEWAQTTALALNIEIKQPGIEAAVAQAVHRYGLLDRVIISSFYPEVLEVLRDTAPEIPRGVLMEAERQPPAGQDQADWLVSELARLGATAWHPARQLPLAELVPRVRAAGYRVNVWTVDEPAVMRQLLALAVDGIITNVPARLGEVMRAWAADGAA